MLYLMSSIYIDLIMSKFSYLPFFISLISLGAGCAPVSPPPAWQNLGNGVEKRVLTNQGAGSATIVLYRLDSSRFRWQFAHDTVPHFISEWRQKFPEATMILNGLYFNEDFSPTGFFKTGGLVVNQRMFDLDRSALLVLKDGFEIIDDPVEMRQAAKDETEAGQSYPLLIKNGWLNFPEESGLAARRTFLATSKNHSLYVGIVPYAPLTLFEFMKALNQEPAFWLDILNLDGGSSSGISLRLPEFQETFDSLTPVPNVIVISSIP
ncbi:phosphodiester glycosidase family protein [Candidatus Uhrbacteria bacterium]|nr:phosphodiester glycosidase family protein [Candidatus Uhrbacteria bacterium]